VTSGANPAATAAPGDVLRYTLRLESLGDVPLNDLTFFDELDRLNSPAAFEPGTLQLVTVPAGADTSNTDPAGGPQGTGVVDVRNLDLSGAGAVLLIEFDITLSALVPTGTVVANQSQLLVAGAPFVDSDDPNVNGPADPLVAGDEDPTRVLIQLPAVPPLLKENTQATAPVGEAFRYRITVPETPYPFALFDVRILDDLTASAADLRFLGVSKVTGSGPWTPANTGTPTDLVIEDAAIGIDIPAGEQVVVEVTVVLENTPTNVAGLQFTNTASFVYRTVDGDPASEQPGSPGTTAPMTVVEPDLTLEKTGPAQMTLGTPQTFTLDIHNVSATPAWNVAITDQLPDTATGGTCDAGPSAITAQLFLADGVTPVSAPLVAGTDFTVAFSGAPGCLLTLGVVSAAGTIGADQRLIVRYETSLDADTQNGAALTNVAGATGWFSADGSNPVTGADRRTYTRTVTDGTVGVLDHEDAHTVTAFIDVPLLFASKDVAILVDAGTPNAVDPGDVLRYTIRVTNSGGVPATGVTLTDSVPANTTYVADSTTLNGLPAGQPDGGTPPLAAGLPISSADLTPPLPGPGAGTLSPGQTAVVEFDLQVDAGVPGGTIISNQAVVGSAELPDLLTDGDGDPSTGPEPTVVIVSAGQQLLITKQVSVVGGGAAVAGSVLEYVVSVTNVAVVPAANVVITDDLDVPTPGQLTYVAPSATLDGSATGVTVVGSLITADYAGSYGDLAPGDSTVLVFQATIDPGLVAGTTVTNTGVVTWGAPPTQTASASVSIDVAAVPAGAVGISKTTPSLDVSRGELVPYEIVISNQLATAIPDLGVVDTFPAGFRYVPGSARVDGLPLEPTAAGQTLTWSGLGIGAASSRRISLVLAVGAGVSEGKYVNRAQAFSNVGGGAVSGVATATVRVAPDPTFTCTDVVGKVFDDVNRNGIQDSGERGLQGIRLVTPRGLFAVTDAYGRYHITCAATPNEARGSNFVLKLDDRTLPSGYRMSTRKLQVARATRGKALRVNYAASIHRVVSLDMADAVFEPGSLEMRPQWRPRIDRLLEELQKGPATLRLSYVADVEGADLVEARLAAVKRQIEDAWEGQGDYELTIEPEIYWRRGAPLDETSTRMRDGG
jgi:uncharacterized repeat protein (TIGR01451 family)